MIDVESRSHSAWRAVKGEVGNGAYGFCQVLTLKSLLVGSVTFSLLLGFLILEADKRDFFLPVLLGLHRIGPPSFLR